MNCDIFSTSTSPTSRDVYSEISFPLFYVNEATQATWLTTDISIYFSVLRAATEYYFEVSVCTVHLFIKQKIEKGLHYKSNYMSEKFIKKYYAYN